MNIKNLINSIQEPLSGMKNPDEEYFERATAEQIENGLKCFVCGNLFELDDPFIWRDIYDTLGRKNQEWFPST